MQHKNSKMDGKTWAELDSVIYAMEPQNEPMGHMDLAYVNWTCDRAGRIKENLSSGSGIKITTGGGITTSLSLADWAFDCDHFDIISVHDYGTNAWNTAAALGDAATKAAGYGKTILFEEWGALGDSKAAIIGDFAEALKSYGIPWLYWEIVKPGKGSSDFEVWTDESAWNVLGNGDDTGAINWSRKAKRQHRASRPAIEMPESTPVQVVGGRMSKVKRSNANQKRHDRSQAAIRKLERNS